MRFAVIKNIEKARDPGKEVILCNMNFPKEFMDLTFCSQPLAGEITAFYNLFAMLTKLLPSGQHLVPHILKAK